MALGAVLAGGRGRRLGGDKAVVELDGVPLLCYPVAAVHAAAGRVVVVAKGDTQLPALRVDADVWVEPDEPRHPLCGIVHALRLAGGEPVLVVAGDMPLLDAATLRRILATDPLGTAAVVPRVEGRLQPLCALYMPRALAELAHYEPASRTTEVVSAIGVRTIDFDDPVPFFNVNAPEDILQASALRAAAAAAQRG